MMFFSDCAPRINKHRQCKASLKRCAIISVFILFFIVQFGVWVNAQGVGIVKAAHAQKLPDPEAINDKAVSALEGGVEKDVHPDPQESVQTRQKPLLDIKPVRSPSGVQAWLVEDHSVPVIALSFSFKGAGAVNDPLGKDGLAQLASNTMDEGAGDIGAQAFQKMLQDYSISLQFSSSRDHFGGGVKTLSKNKDKAFDLLALSLASPRFDDDAVARMKRANQSRIRRAQSDPAWTAARIMNDKAFAGHPYARNSGGTLSTLEGITSDDLRAFHKTLRRDDVVIGAAGDITPNELSAVLERVFGALKSGDADSDAQGTSSPPAPAAAPQNTPQPLTLQNAGKMFVHKKDIPQSVIRITQGGIDRTSPDYHTAQVMNYILGSGGFGSRLTTELQEKRGLTYGVNTYFQDMRDIDTLSISTSTKNDTAGKAIDLIKAEWRKMRDAPVSAEELRDAKAYLIGSLPLSLTSTDSIAALLRSLQMDNLPLDYLDARAAAIKGASAADIQTLAKNLLLPDTFVTVVVGAPSGVPASSYEIVQEINGVK